MTTQEEKKSNNDIDKSLPDEKNQGSVYAKKKQFNNKKKRSFKDKQEKPEFEQKIVDIARVTRVMAGGKRMSFRACVAIGDRNGRVAIGLAKGADVTIAVNKAVNRAKKEWVEVPMVNDTIPHDVYQKHGAAKILLTNNKVNIVKGLMVALKSIRKVEKKVEKMNKQKPVQNSE